MRPKGFLYGEYSEEFDRLRKNRVQVSYHKYGPAAKNFGEGRVDRWGPYQHGTGVVNDGQSW